MKKFILILLPLFFLTACGEKKATPKNNYYKEVKVYNPTPKKTVTTHILDDDFAYASTQKPKEIEFQKSEKSSIQITGRKNNPPKIISKPKTEAPKTIPRFTESQIDENTPKKISFFTVKEHNSESDCWFIIGKEVFDVTEWIPVHPGGPLKILKNCGKNATKDFDDQHGGISSIAKKLQSFKVGDLK